MTMTDEVTREWTRHPIITTAKRNVGDGADTLDLLFEAREIMLGIEDRFPNMTFGEFFDAGSTRNKRGLAQRLQDNGTSVHDIGALLGDAAIETRDEIGVLEYDMARDGATREAMIEVHGYSKTQADSIRAMSKPLTPVERFVLDLWIDCDGLETNKVLADRAGTTIRTVAKAIRKYRYQNWLGSQR